MTAILTYKLGSKSAKTLSKELGWRRVRAQGNFRNNYRHKIINWGCSTEPTFPTPHGILNRPEAVALASNKLKTLNTLKEHSVPTLRYYTSREDAQIEHDDGVTIYARKTLTGRSGQGIIVYEGGTESTLEYAPLYTEFFDKTKEYRVHATRTKVFDYQAKLKRSGEEADPWVYSYDNGRVFCRGGIELPEAVATASMQAIEALGLDFGAVDIGIDEEGNVAVFELNSAPALEGTTI
jgi:glutathione synthase/RimK-type ligase-like ATP-grasp enzyme